jgi:putative oxidoreductase
VVFLVIGGRLAVLGLVLVTVQAQAVPITDEPDPHSTENDNAEFSLVDATRFRHHNGVTTMNATRYIPFAGRLLIGLPFAMSGLGKLAAIGPTTELIRAAGLPLPPAALAVAVIIELGGGLSLVAGFRVRIAATALALFSFATAMSFHTNFADQNQMIHFLKNVMIAGGLLQIVAFGAGALSIDTRIKKGGTQGAS